MEALCSTSKHGTLSPIILLIIGTGMCLCASQTQATTINLNVYDKAGSVDTSTLNVWVDVIDNRSSNRSSVDFVFHNDSTDGFIANIYIEDTDFSSQYLSNGAIYAASDSDVNFSTEKVSPPQPAGSISNYGGDWEGNLFSAYAKTPSKNGIKPGESLTVRFNYSGIDFATLIAAMSDPAKVRIAEHIQGISSNSVSVWTTNTTVPQPATLMLLAAGLPFLRRKRA